jgi:hypothetical protein
VTQGRFSTPARIHVAFGSDKECIAHAFDERIIAPLLGPTRRNDKTPTIIYTPKIGVVGTIAIEFTGFAIKCSVDPWIDWIVVLIVRYSGRDNPMLR